MPARAPVESPAQALARKRRLHPVAFFQPFNSYSRPNRLGGFAVNRWLIVVFVIGVLLTIDYFVDSFKSGFVWNGGSPGFEIETVGDDGSAELSRELERAAAVVTLGFVFALGCVFLWLVSRWWTFRWWVDDGAIWTSGGIVNSWRRRVAVSDIVIVDRSSTLVSRVFGTSRVTIETTATDTTVSDVTLGALSRKQAALLDALLLDSLIFDRHEKGQDRFDPLPIDRVSWWQLALTGAASLQITRAGIVLYAFIRFFSEASPEDLANQYAKFVDYLIPGHAPDFIARIFGVVLALWLASVIYYVASFYRFRLGKHDAWLIVQTGFFRRSRRWILADGIQGLSVKMNPLQRIVGTSMLSMRMPVYGSPPLYALVLHPSVSAENLPRLTREIVGMDADVSRSLLGKGIQPLSAESRKLYILLWPMRLAALAGALFAYAWLSGRAVEWVAWLLVVAIAPFAIRGNLVWKHTGWYADRDRWLVVQGGIVNRTATAARVDRVKYVQWSQGIFSRPNTICSLSLCVATSGGAGLIPRILALFSGSSNPSIVRFRLLTAGEARLIARASGIESTMPPGLRTGSDVAATVVAMPAGVDESGRSDLLPQVSTEPGPSGRSE